LSPDVHANLRRTVAALSGYPDAPDQMEAYNQSANDPAQLRRMLRAAFGIMRSIYSVAALARFDLTAVSEPIETVNLPDHDHGLFEDNRRQLNWLLSRAKQFDEQEAPFRAEEMVWLFNECGVHSLAQGRLLDAVAMFNTALLAAAEIEPREQGALHTRIRLNKALCDIERGRGTQARRHLERIAQSNPREHPVPGIIAKGYLGWLDHLAGNHDAASAAYEMVVSALLDEGQSRAASIFARQHADMSRSTDQAAASKLAEEAIEFAMRGGHEDIRHQAVLSRIKIRIAAHDGDLATLHRELDVVERYARFMGMPRLTCRAAELRARLHHRAGDMQTAGTIATRGLEIAARNGLRTRETILLLLLARINLDRGQRAAARPLLHEADLTAREAEYHYIRPEIHELRNRVAY
jgi:hypothetical protein